jgi:hypothetical protein
MKAVGSDDEIEISCASALERDLHAFLRLVDAIYAIAKDRFDFAFDLAEDRCREGASRNAGKSTARDPGKCFGGKTCHASPTASYDFYFSDRISMAADLRQQTHALCNVVTRAPEVDQVTINAQAGRRFNDGGRESVMG